MNEPRHLENLNPPQKEAVLHSSGPILVLAGAGTGKTRVLTRRIANLIIDHRVRAYSILAVTFTNKAAGEMKARLNLLIGNLASSLWVSTFHSLGLRILRRNAEHIGFKSDFTVYDAADSKEVIKRLLKEQKIDEKRFPISSFASYIEKQKNIPIFPEQLGNNSKSSNDEDKKEIYELYQRALRNANAMDFGDLLSFTYQLLATNQAVREQYQHQFEYVLVDEFQDTNDVQYKIVKLLAGEKKNLLVVGDDDQSIYAFRGATIQNILDFEDDFADTKVIKLEQNYRSTSNILDSAHSVILKNSGRKDKKVWTAQGSGEPLHLFAGSDETEEANFIAREINKRIDAGISFQDIACFYRTNAQSRALEEAFLTYKIPYRIFGGLKFYDRKEIKDLIAYLRLIANQSDDQAFLRIINTPTRGIGAQTIVTIAQSAKLDGISFFESAREVVKSNKSVAAFVRLIDGFIAEYQNKRLHELLQKITEKTDYVTRLRAMKDDPQAQSRIENIQELIGLAITTEFAEDQDPLQQFLDRVALSTSEENSAAAAAEATKHESGDQKAPSNTVSLMTLHLAKGLEYEIVFFTGFEEGLIPHQRTFNSPDEIEEERRLTYVGMTRAKHALYITRSKKRGMFSAGGAGSYGEPGSSRFREASRFAFDIPKTMIDDPLGSFFTSMEYESYGYDDSSSRRSGDDEIDPLSFGGGQKKRGVQPDSNRRRFVPFNPNAMVKSADELFDEAADKVNHLPPVADEDLCIGLDVIHPSFGKGKVEAIDGGGEDANASKVKVSIFFDQLADTKKLIFRYAGLRHAS